MARCVIDVVGEFVKENYYLRDVDLSLVGVERIEKGFVVCNFIYDLTTRELGER
jgi:hypothetical protein